MVNPMCIFFISSFLCYSPHNYSPYHPSKPNPPVTYSHIQPPQSHSPKPAIKTNPDEKKAKINPQSSQKRLETHELNDKKFQHEPQSISSGLMQFSTSKNAASELILTDSRKALALGWRRKEEEEGREGRGVFYSWL